MIMSGPDDPANRIYGKIILPNVHPVKTGRHGQICPIIHNERYFHSKRPAQFARMRQHLP